MTDRVTGGVRVIFDRTVPAAERAWMGRLARRSLRRFGLDGWELQICARSFRSPVTVAEIRTRTRNSSRIARIQIAPARFADRRGLRADLRHELFHLVDDEVWQTFEDLAAHIPNRWHRARARERARRRYEAWHDRLAQVVCR